MFALSLFEMQIVYAIAPKVREADSYIRKVGQYKWSRQQSSAIFPTTEPVVQLVEVTEDIHLLERTIL